MNDSRHVTRLIFIGLLIAIALMLIPLPSTLAYWRPDFATLVLMYWWLAHPERVGVFYGFAIGILMDVMYGSLFGQYAIGNIFIAWVFMKNYQRMRVLPTWQQALSIFGLLLIKYFIVFWIDKLRGNNDNSFWMYLAPCLTSALIWPYLFNLLRQARRRAKIRYGS